ncbi:unnamed protein product [Paramecium octaurelia]|uniref:WD domain, G-beta repeat protein n=1 Tax=Paramecium octaurelia TaxID=43137 RepID=A0A8S1Y897_PAROT|nr:unnamed protein product [Paramecium octaurelia]
MQTISEQNLRIEYQRKVNECIESLYLAVELSFNKIDAQLDQILNHESNPAVISQLQCDLSKFNQNCVFKLKNDNFSTEINQEVTSLIKNNIQHQIQQFTNSQTIEQSSTLSSIQSNLKPFIYQLVPQNSIQQNEVCRAIAINKDCSVLIAACQKQIKVFEFKSGMLKQTQILSQHNHNVYTLNFMNKSDQFISGSSDNLIIIWIKNENNQWVCKQKINGHTRYIICLVLNNNEDLIVSGSYDYTIKFWQKENEWLCSQTITDHTSYVYGLSFNEQQNKLISCGSDQHILVIEQSQLNKQWIVIQKLKVEQYGKRLCFIDDNTFTFQPYDQEQLHVFEIDSTNKYYTKTKHISVKGGLDSWLFPQQYVKSKCMLLNKNAQNVNLIRKTINGEFITEQSIEFGTIEIYGCMSGDGQYLITWDDKSKEYQIRKYQEK